MLLLIKRFIVVVFLGFLLFNDIAVQAHEHHAVKRQVEMAIYFTGIEKGNNCKKFNQAEKDIYQAVYQLLENGIDNTRIFFNNLYNLSGGKKFVAQGVHFFAGDDIDNSIKRIQPNAFPEKIPLKKLGIAFFTLDDTIILTEITSQGMKKVALYMLISFFVFNFERQLIIYNNQFVLPLEANTFHTKNNYEFVKEFLKNEQSAKFSKGNSSGNRFEKVMKQMTISVLRDKWFKTVMKNLKVFSDLESNQHVGQVSINNLQIKRSNNIHSEYQMKLKNENKFRQLAAYMATTNFSFEVPLNPAFVDVEKYMTNQQEAIMEVIKDQFKAVGEKVTGLLIDLRTELNHGYDENSGTFDLARLFVSPKYKFNMDITLYQKRVSKNSFRIEDNVQAEMTLSIYKRHPSGGFKEIQPKKNKTKLVIKSQQINHSFVFGKNVKMSDSYFYNAMLKGMKQNRDIIIFDKPNNTNGVYESIQ